MRQRIDISRLNFGTTSGNTLKILIYEKRSQKNLPLNFFLFVYSCPTLLINVSDKTELICDLQNFIPVGQKKIISENLQKWMNGVKIHICKYFVKFFKTFSIVNQQYFNDLKRFSQSIDSLHNISVSSSLD
jgi:hypothetical protein